jgi:phage shock protein A
MPHFSRLTDIVTCNLTEILKSAEDPALTLREILAEMEEGLAACRRSVRTSGGNHERLKKEIAEHQQQIAEWISEARKLLSAGDEVGAREALTRKVELEGLVAGLQPEMEAAMSTCQHMLRIQRALEARHSDAARRLTELTGEPGAAVLESQTAVHAAAAAAQQKQDEVEAELAALRKQLGQ